MKPPSFILVCIQVMLSLYVTEGQVALSSDGLKPDNSAMLDVRSTNKGMLVPRMTQEQIAAISKPADGLIAYNTDSERLYIYVASAGAWKEILFGSETISPTFICGSSLTINHTEGAVAPVTKTVTYGTVTNIPGETSKCWITSNLGADHQADSVNDISEASAGWYWQFNLRRGYKCTGGLNIYPSWAIFSIVENSNWVISKDPCNLELGGGWRIPTQTEWYNIDASGGWTNWYGPWNSALKLHAAGIIQTEGGLIYRGTHGNYWSSNERSSSMSYNLFFINTLSQIVNDYKAMGAPVRCLREQ